MWAPGESIEQGLASGTRVDQAFDPTAPPRRRGWQLALAFLVAVALALGVGFGLHARGGDAAPAFETLAVDRGDITARVTATGTLSALVTVQVGSQVSGTVSALYADYNSHVRRGEVIARIDPALFDAAFEPLGLSPAS